MDKIFISPNFLCFPLAFCIAVCQYIDMFCINCFNPSTQVVNSRAKKKQALIWRRRHCLKCNITFTTHERPALTDNKKVYIATNQTTIFNPGQLLLSIARAFPHSPNTAKQHAYALTQTVENILSTQTQIITPDEIAVTTHAVLKRFDELAALQYAAMHQLVTSTRRRGRPSVAWREQLSDE
jgi:transcriptional regulator NrdR family protein